MDGTQAPRYIFAIPRGAKQRESLGEGRRGGRCGGAPVRITGVCAWRVCA